MAYLESLGNPQIESILKERYSGVIPWTIRLDTSEKIDRITRLLVGNKAFGMIKMYKVGLPVPDGFVLTTQVWHEMINKRLFNKEKTEALFKENPMSAMCFLLKDEIVSLSQKTGCSFDDREKPLFVSARSGSSVSMPGAMSTILNIGINDKTWKTLSKEIGQANAAKAYIDLILNLIPKDFREEISIKNEFETEGDLNDFQIAEYNIKRAKEFYESITLNDFPQEGLIQLQNATLQVFSSWFSEDAVLYRRQYNIPHDLGTTVTVVQMKLGNSLKDNAGSGVLLTMNPQTLDQSPIVAFVEHQQGTAVVGENKHSYTEINQLPQTVNQQLVSLLEIINDKFGLKPQDVEFVFDGDQVWLLQIRDAPLGNLANFRLLNRYITENIITPGEAIREISTSQLETILKPTLDTQAVKEAIEQNRLIATGDRITSGHASGNLVFSFEQAQKIQGPVVLNTYLSLVDTILIPPNVVGIIATNGGIGSHIARRAEVIGRNGIPVVFGVNLQESQIPLDSIVTVDGDSGHIFSGVIPEAKNEINHILPEEKRLVQLWLEKRLKNPWWFCSDDEGKLNDYTDQALLALNEAKLIYKSQKAWETYVLNKMFPQEVRMNYSIMDPQDIEGIKSKLKDIIERGNHASIRTCHTPQLQGGGPWASITNQDDIERMFRDVNFSKYGNYGQMISSKENKQVTEILVGEFPKDKLSKDPEIEKQIGTWTLNISPIGRINLQFIPYSAQLRLHDQTSKENMISYSTESVGVGYGSQQSSALSKLEIGKNLENDEIAKVMFFTMVSKLSEQIASFDLLERIAAVTEAFPRSQYGIPTIEGHLRLQLDKGQFWMLIYGLKIDLLNN